MYTVQNVSILELRLDAKNPRFILPNIGESQENIRKYLLDQENAVYLIKNIVDYGGLMPGERIVVTKENDQYVVLEGNRRTCACQMLVDRSLIPINYIDKIPPSSDNLINSISNVFIDVIPTREESRRFLATRHIERAREWSTIAKMRFCYEDYEQGKYVSQIKERTGLSTTDINKYINNYKLLIRGLEYNWLPDEKQKLFLLDIEPDKLLRIFSLKDTKSLLQLYFDSNHNLCSNNINKKDLDEIIHIWTRKAFIDNEMDTRTSFGEYHSDNTCTGACRYISHILDKYFCNKTAILDEVNINKKDNNIVEITTSGIKNTSGNVLSSTVDLNSNDIKNTVEQNKDNNINTIGENNTSGGPNVSNFFGGLNWSNINENEYNGKGVITICIELVKISNTLNFVKNHPICTVFIIRALIEQSIKYHAKKNNYWQKIMQQLNYKNNNYGDPQLSFILNEYKNNLKDWIPEQNIRRIFDIVFNKNIQIDKFNLVVHSPENYSLSPETIKSLPNEGLLALVNYFLA